VKFFYLIAISFLLFTSKLYAVDYISSVYSGYQLGNLKESAVITQWSPQNKVTFDGAGPIKMQNKCLTAVSGQSATWESCNESRKSQFWFLEKNRLMNKWSYCLDLEKEASAINTHIITAECTNKTSQKWKLHP
jgi:hypothetical protein